MARMSSKDGVVDLTAYRGGSSADCFAELETYWKTICAGRIMPYRDELDPRGIAGALQNVFLLERITPDIARFRLAGQQILGHAGMDLAGLPFGAMFTPQSRKRMGGTLRALFNEPARIELELDGGRSFLRKPLAARVLLLPLRDRDGEVNRAVGCFAANGGAISKPQTFEVRNETRRTLVGYGTLPAAPVAPPMPVATAEERRAQIRLVTND